MTDEVPSDRNTESLTTLWQEYLTSQGWVIDHRDPFTLHHPSGIGVSITKQEVILNGPDRIKDIETEKLRSVEILKEDQP